MLSDALYTILILPLETVYRVFYELCYSIAGNYVISLLLLSIMTSLLMLPLNWVANSARDREKSLQLVLGPAAEKISGMYSGEERYLKLKELYKRYAYSPLLAMRSSAAVFIQLPFFIGAYAMLGSYQPLAGQRFWLIGDLAAPDGLLWGFNLLPLLMTTLNIGAALTAMGTTFRDKAQALCVALFFLVLLYGAPSALLIYWTCNNLLSLLENLFHWFFKRFFKMNKKRMARSLKKWENCRPERPVKNYVLALTAALAVVLAPPLYLKALAFVSARSDLNAMVLAMAVGCLAVYRLFSKSPGSGEAALKQLLVAAIWGIGAVCLALIVTGVEAGQFLRSCFYGLMIAAPLVSWLSLLPWNASLIEMWRGLAFFALPATVAAGLLSLMLWALRGLSPEPPLLISAAVCLTAGIAAFRNHADKTEKTKIILLYLPLAAVVCIAAAFGSGRVTAGYGFYATLAVAQIMAGLCVLPSGAAGRSFGRIVNAVSSFCNSLFQNRIPSVYAASTLLLGAVLFIFSPLTIMTTSTFDIPVAQYGDATHGFVVLFVIWLIGWAYVWLAAGARLRSCLTLALCLAALLMSFDVFIFVRDYGQLDVNRLASETLLGAFGENLAVDAASLVLVMLLLSAQRRLCAVRIFTAFFHATAAAIFIFCGSNLFTPVFQHVTEKKEQTERLQATIATAVENEKKWFQFSKKGPNVLFIGLDAAAGTAFGHLINEYPELKNKFAGFTWYRDTISDGNYTSVSKPSLLGGPGYRLPNLLAKAEASIGMELQEIRNDLDYAPLVKVQDEGYAFLGHKFKAANFDARFLLIGSNNFPKELPWNYSHHLPASDNAILAEQIYGANDGLVFRKELLDLSIFRAAPHMLKKYVYNDGAWLPHAPEPAIEADFPDDPFFKNHAIMVMSETTRLANWPKYAQINADAPTFRVLYMIGTHPPHLLSKDSLTPTTAPLPGVSWRDYIMPEGALIDPRQYNSVVHYMRLLGEVFEWMKQADIYDNTMIVIASDHSEVDLLGAMPFPKNPIKALIRSDATLLVKEINAAKEPLRVSDQFMQTSDVPFLLCQTIGGCDGIAKPDWGPDRLRYHFVTVGGAKPRYGLYKIRGAGFDPKNWEYWPDWKNYE